MLNRERRNRSSIRRTRRLCLERLEDRFMLTTWTGDAANQNFNDPGNWEDSVLPSATETVRFDLNAGSVQVTAAISTNEFVVAEKKVTLDLGPTLYTSIADIRIGTVDDAELVLTTQGTFATGGGNVLVRAGLGSAKLRIESGAFLDLKGNPAPVPDGFLNIAGTLELDSGFLDSGETDVQGLGSVSVLGDSIWNISESLTIHPGGVMSIQSSEIVVNGFTAIREDDVFFSGTVGKLTLEAGGKIRMNGGGENLGTLEVRTGGKLIPREVRFINRGRVIAGASPGQFTVGRGKGVRTQ